MVCGGSTLPRIKVSGLNRTVLSMDYNFLVAHSRGVADPRRSTQFRDQMLQSYLDYFRTNYTGNRAPLHIGHHFSGYQSGAYNAALKEFARMVCALPEVRCVSYTALANSWKGSRRRPCAAYRSGGFPRAEAPVFPSPPRRPARAARRHRPRIVRNARPRSCRPPSRAWRACG